MRLVLRQQLPDLGDGAAEVAAFEPRRDGHVLPQVLAPQLELAGLLGDVGDLRELAPRAPSGVRSGSSRSAADAVDPGRVDQHADLHHAVAFEQHARRGLPEHGGVHGRGHVVAR